MKHTLALTGLLLSALLLASCSDTDEPRGRLSVSLTDGPVEADKVVIHFTGATIQPASGDRYDIVVTDPGNNQSIGRSIDLLEFTGSESTVLFNEELPKGQYSWIRLDVDFDPLKTYLQNSTGNHALSCTSCENNGLKLNNSFTVNVSQTTSFILDFELQQSITEANGNYKLRPTVRIIETAAAGGINGNVDPTLMASIGGNDGGCTVYVYAGSDVTPNDIYIPDTGSAPDGYSNPVSTTAVDLATNTYAAAYLPAGEYTVSLTCDAELDEAELENNLSFTGTTNVLVYAGLFSLVDFPAP